MRDSSINNPNPDYNDENYNGARRLTRNFVDNNSNTSGNNVMEMSLQRFLAFERARARAARRAFAREFPLLAASLNESRRRRAFQRMTTARRLNFGDNDNGNNGNTRPNAGAYSQNEKRMKKNVNANNKTNKITWKNVNVKNIPSDPISTENFNIGDKAVKINKLYLAPNSFRKLARMSMTSAINANGNMVLFKNPMTRGKVKKSDLEFVIIRRAAKK